MASANTPDLQEREAEKTVDVVTRQLQAVASKISEQQWANIVIAYEPIWYVYIFATTPIHS